MIVKFLFTVFLLATSTSFAESIDKWQIKITDEYKNYSTIYTDGSEFGITCKSICFYYLIQNQDCDKDSEDLTLLINSIGETLLVKNKCVQQSNTSFYTFNEFREMTNFLKNEDTAQLINNLKSNKTNRVINYSIIGFQSIIEKYFSYK